MAEYIERKALINELSASCIPIDNREISGLLGCNESIRDIIDAIPDERGRQSRESLRGTHRNRVLERTGTAQVGVGR